jgi:pilus assembly protein CpaB
MKPKTMILLAVAIGCGLVASYLTSKVLADRGSGEQQVEMVTVLAAKKNLGMGTVLKDPEKFFIEKEIPKSAAPKKGFTSFDDIKNLKLVKPVSEDAFITKDDIMDSGSDIFIQNIPPGYRAVSLKVTADTLVGGFVQANTRVDVLTTMRRENGESSSQVILQNVLVLATDQDDQRDPDKKGKLANTVTLAAKPEDALKIRLASSVGEVSLVLRKYGEEDISNTKIVKVGDIVKGTQSSSDPSSDDGNGGRETTAGPSPDIKVSEPPKIEEKVEKEAVVKYWVQEIRNGENVVRIKRREDGKDLEDSTEITKTDAAPKPQKKSFETPKPGAKPEGETSKGD